MTNERIVDEREGEVMGDFDFFELSFFFDSRGFLSTLSFDLERLGGDLERDLLEREALYSSLIVVCDLSL